MSDEQGIEITEDVETFVTDEGDVVTDDVIIAVDEATGDALVDETITVEAADGSAAAEEIITAIDGETGEAEVVADVVGDRRRGRRRGRRGLRRGVGRGSSEYDEGSCLAAGPLVRSGGGLAVGRARGAPSSMLGPWGVTGSVTSGERRGVGRLRRGGPRVSRGVPPKSPDPDFMTERPCHTAGPPSS